MRLLKFNDVFNTTVEVKRSKFISYIMPYEDFKVELERLKNQHPKARHFVYAWRALNEHSQIVEQSSDDGEPRGTSGKPTLNVLQGNSLINIAIITVRYFGGTKLGTGGLVRAYTDATNSVINSVEFENYISKTSLNMRVEYSQFEKFKYLLNSYEAKIKTQEFLTDFIEVEIDIALESKDEFTELAKPLFYI